MHLFSGISEKLLQYIWQHQYFNQSDLTTTSGENLKIILPGTLNKNQGPDFNNARVKVGDTVLVGSVELHLKTSQWQEHGHQNDPNYRNVILHVVLENDLSANDIPVLELQSRIPGLLLQRYEKLMDTSSFIPCSHAIGQVKSIVWVAWKERLLAERLTRKSQMVLDYLKQSNGHWEETFWWMLARNFGVKVNAEAFEAVARSVSINILAKHKNQIHQLEALLFGQAGLLSQKHEEEYPKLLYREYSFLAKKYHLKTVQVPMHLLRMRPGNFPTIRLAQLAMLIHQAVHLFSRILDADSITEIKSLFVVTANDYWHYHYLFDELSPFKKKTLGQDMIDNLIINTVVPVLFSYGLYHQEEMYKTQAIRWLEETTAESNSIVKGFRQLDLASGSAYDSQALIELKTQYCDNRLCLSCSVGNSILKG